MIKPACSLLLSLSLLAAPEASCESVAEDAFDGVERIVAFGDVHGAYDELVKLLSGIGLIDEQTRWSGGSTHLVSLGDLVDRGAQSKAVIDLLRRLQTEARDGGGRVHVLLGNHELMNLTYDFADLSDGEIASHGGLERFIEGFSETGDYGRWLLSLPLVLRINDSLFLHGGLSGAVTSVTGTNRRAAEQLKRLKAWGDARVRAGEAPISLFEIEDGELPAAALAARSDPAFASEGPLWYRGNARCPPALEAPRLERDLARLGVARVIVGHTPTPTREVTTRFGQKVWIVDTGMLASVYRGRPRAIEILADRIRVLTPEGYADPVADLPVNARRVAILSQGDIIERDDDLIVRSGDAELPVEFRRVRAASRRRALAAFALDQLLGLDLVPAVAERTLNGKTGLLTHRRSYVLERDRDFGLDNFCASGSVFDLVQVLDGLMGKRDRGAENLAYEARTRRLRLLDNGDAFARSAALPTYATPPRLAPGAESLLRELTRPVLDEALGDVLKPAEIEGILRRRDEMLAAWGGAREGA